MSATFVTIDPKAIHRYLNVVVAGRAGRADLAQDTGIRDVLRTAGGDPGYVVYVDTRALAYRVARIILETFAEDPESGEVAVDVGAHDALNPSLGWSVVVRPRR